MPPHAGTWPYPVSPLLGSLPPLGGHQPLGGLDTQTPLSSPAWHRSGQQRDSTTQLSASPNLTMPNRPAQGLPARAAEPTPPAKPAVPPGIFGPEQDSRELTVPRLSPAQPPSLQGPKGTQASASSPPTSQGPCGCQPVAMAPTRTPQGCQPASACLPICCHGDQRCGDRRGWSLTPQQGCSHPPPPGLGRGPSVKPLPQAACWGCSDTAMTSLHPGQLV